MTPTLPYVAGFFDGEGSIGIYPDGRGRYHLRSQLVQNVSPTSVVLFNYLQDRWGGNLSIRSGKRDCYNWQTNSNTAASFLKDILPYLLLKRDEAELSLMWQWARPLPSRDAKGHFVSVKYAIDEEIASVVKRLKTERCEDEVQALRIKLHMWAARNFMPVIQEDTPNGR